VLADLSLLRGVADTAVHGPARCRLEGHHHRFLAAPTDGRMLSVIGTPRLLSGLLAARTAALRNFSQFLGLEDFLPAGREMEGLAAVAADHHLVGLGSCLIHHIFPCLRLTRRIPTSTLATP
jgi:hypothetical protein